MKMDLQIKGLDSVLKQLNQLSRDGLKASILKSINDSAFEAQRQIKRNMFQVFDRPMTYLPKTILVVPATAENLTAKVSPTRLDSSAVDPQKILQAQEFGGSRLAKRYEVALRSIGVLPPGYITSIPDVPFSGSGDGRGNLNGRFVMELLNYFKANGRQVAGLSKRRLSTLNRTISHTSVMSRTKSGLMNKEVRLLHGHEMFISDGQRGLAAGIWARKVPRSKELKPVVIFIDGATYKPRLGVGELANDGKLQAYFEKRLRFRIRQAVESLGT